MTIPLELAVYAAAVFLCYLPALNGPAIFDDTQVLKELERFEWKKTYFKRDNYRILTLLSFALQKQAWPHSMRSLHLGNMAIHAVNGLLVKAIGSKLGMDDGLALFAGLLFVVHPFAVNSVGYITGRASLLSSTFGFAAVLAVLSGYPILALSALGLSFSAKEDGAGFIPLVLCILIYRSVA